MHANAKINRISPVHLVILTVNSELPYIGNLMKHNDQLIGRDMNHK